MIHNAIGLAKIAYWACVSALAPLVVTSALFMYFVWGGVVYAYQMGETAKDRQQDQRMDFIQDKEKEDISNQNADRYERRKNSEQKNSQQDDRLNSLESRVNGIYTSVQVGLGVITILQVLNFFKSGKVIKVTSFGKE